MTIVVIDLIPALLSWEGRDRSTELVLAPDAVEAVNHLYAHYRLMGTADAELPSEVLRAALEEAGLIDLFDTVATSAAFGPVVDARVIRRLTTFGRATPQVVVVTSRRHLVTPLNRARIGVVLARRDEFGGVPEAVASLLTGRVSP